MKWIFKAITQKILCFLPFPFRLNFFLQRYISVGKELPDSFVISRVKEAQRHLDNMIEFGDKSIKDSKIFEIGTGWYPIVPIVYFLSGADHIETSDVCMLHSKTSIDQTLKALIKLNNKGLLEDEIRNFHKGRTKKLSLAIKEKSVSKKFELLNIKSSVFEHNYFPAETNSVDFLTSNNTFQFIEKSHLNDMMSEFNRIGKGNSLVSLSIDLTDEFSHKDDSIGHYNFLKFSDSKWKFITCKLNSTNRLRHSDYKNLFENHLKILNEEITIGSKGELDEITIHQEFLKYKLDDLLIKYTSVILIRKQSNIS